MLTDTHQMQNTPKYFPGLCNEDNEVVSHSLALCSDTKYALL